MMLARSSGPSLLPSRMNNSNAKAGPAQGCNTAVYQKAQQVSNRREAVPVKSTRAKQQSSCRYRRQSTHEPLEEGGERRRRPGTFSVISDSITGSFAIRDEKTVNVENETLCSFKSSMGQYRARHRKLRRARGVC